MADGPNGSEDDWHTTHVCDGGDVSGSDSTRTNVGGASSKNMCFHSFLGVKKPRKEAFGWIPTWSYGLAKMQLVITKRIERQTADSSYAGSLDSYPAPPWRCHG
jgi:hypothetical protein